MEPLFPIVLLLTAYLIGSIPFSFLIVRLLTGADIRQHGSGNVGATNVLRNFGRAPGLIALVLDLAKGWAAVTLARWFVVLPAWPLDYTLNAEWIHAPSFWIGAAALAAVLGHIFPVWLGFEGGKGVATATGVFLGLAPAALGAGLLLFLIVVLLTRYISLGSIVAAAAIPVWIRFLGDAPIWTTVFAIVISLLVIVKHHANIARLARGEERKFPR
jgi:acyl phosphate:glycerol-3-phosphate acyltransferase